MYSLHSWPVALRLANGLARAYGRRQRVRWSPESLCWTVQEVGA